MVLHCIACILHKHDEYVVNEGGRKAFDCLLAFSLRLLPQTVEPDGRDGLNWLIAALVHAEPTWIDSLYKQVDLGKVFSPPITQSSDEIEWHLRRALALLDTLCAAVQSERVIDSFVASPFFAKLTRLFAAQLQQMLDERKPAASGTYLSVFVDKFKGLLIGGTDNNTVPRAQAVRMDKCMKVLVSVCGFKVGQEWLASSPLGKTTWHLLVEIFSYAPSVDKLSIDDQLWWKVIMLMHSTMWLRDESSQRDLSELVVRMARERPSVMRAGTFWRRLVNHMMLDEPRIGVCVDTPSDLIQLAGQCNSALPNFYTHPRFGTGASSRLLQSQFIATTLDAIMQYVIANQAFGVQPQTTAMFRFFFKNESVCK